MIKRIAIVIAFFCVGRLAAQNQMELTTSQKHNAQNAAGFVRYYYDAQNIKQLEAQQLAWQQVVAEERDNAAYWLNYYMVARLCALQKDMGGIDEVNQAKLFAIAGEAQNAIKADYTRSFEKALILYFTEKDNEKALVYLKAAEKLDADNIFILPELARYYDFKNDVEQRDKVLQKIRGIGTNSSIYQYCMHLLNTLPDSCLLISNGDYDTFALWLASHKTGKNIKVLSLKLAENKLYRQKALQAAGLIDNPDYADKNKFIQGIAAIAGQTKVFVSLTVNPGCLKEVSNTLYNIGYCYQYAAIPFDNISPLYTNLVENPPGTSPLNANEVFKNLLPGYITLYRTYKNSDTEKAGKVLSVAKQFAVQQGFWKTYEPYFK